jgi:nucleoside-diphosphate-sugar epimerase
MKVVLTGAAGKLGAYVCRQLVADGHTVRATDRVPRTDLPAPLELLDLLRPESAAELLPGAEALVHVANHPDCRPGEAHRIFNENVAMNFNLFEAARAGGVKQVIFTSSVQVMAGGLPPYLPFDGQTPAQPGNPYALSKQVSEIMLADLARTAGVAGIAIRFPWLVDEDLLRQIRNKTPWAARKPEEGCSYLHLRDAAALIGAILKSDLPGFRVYFPAAGSAHLKDGVPATIAQHYAGIPLRRPAREIKALVDTTQITRETGWEPVHSRR